MVSKANVRKVLLALECCARTEEPLCKVCPYRNMKDCASECMHAATRLICQLMRDNSQLLADMEALPALALRLEAVSERLKKAAEQNCEEKC